MLLRAVLTAQKIDFLTIFISRILMVHHVKQRNLMVINAKDFTSHHINSVTLENFVIHISQFTHYYVWAWQGSFEISYLSFVVVSWYSSTSFFMYYIISINVVVLIWLRNSAWHDIMTHSLVYLSQALTV